MLQKLKYHQKQLNQKVYLKIVVKIVKILLLINKKTNKKIIFNLIKIFTITITTISKIKIKTKNRKLNL